MKYGLIADIHLSISDNLSPLDSKTGLSYRTLDRLDGIYKALDISVQEECEAFFILGDTFDKLNPPESFKEHFLNTILPFSEKIKIYIIPGNHDGTAFTHNYLTEAALMRKLEKPTINIIDEIDTIYLNRGKDKFHIIPWIEDHSKIKNGIDVGEEGMIFLGHLEIQGALASTEYVLTKGLHPGVFQKYKRAFLGHYHKRQQIGNILYVGSPFIKDFSEINDWATKGFIIYDSEKDTWEEVQLEKRGFFRYYITNETLDSIDEELESVEPSEGSILKLKLEGSKEWISHMLPKILEVFKQYKPLKILREKIFIKEQLKEVHEVLVKTNRIERIKEISKDESNEIRDIGIEIYKEAENEYREIFES
jgi:DNA repair exonuclease SbcCD nuclease subunit